MRKSTLKFPVLLLIASALAASSLGACGSDSSNATCGNNAVEGSEQCDGTDLHGGTCQSATMNPNSTGMLACNVMTCQFDLSHCTGVGGGSGTGGGPNGTGGGP